MNNETGNKPPAAFIIAFLTGMLFLLQGVCLPAEYYGGERVRIAFFPFQEVETGSFNKSIPAILMAEFSAYTFIETVPVEVIQKEIYEIEPSYLWTKRKNAGDSGGIIWDIKPEIFEEVEKTVAADLFLYGDVIRSGDTWTVVIYIAERNDREVRRPVTISGVKDDEMPDRLKKAAREIMQWLEKKNILHEAEENIRRYMGGMYTHGETVSKIKALVESYPGSIPLRAILLDLYHREKEKYHREIMREGMKMADLYDPENDEDTRYLLSLNMDPFDMTAAIFESRNDWENALSLRHKAEKLFPHNNEQNRRALGRDYYFYALFLEKKGDRKKALEKYKDAMTYLDPSSEYYSHARDACDVLTKKKASGN